MTRVLTDPRQLEESLLVGNPDVVTQDKDVPHRPGLEVLSALASRQLADRVIILSGTPPTCLKDKAYVGNVMSLPF